MLISFFLWYLPFLSFMFFSFTLIFQVIWYINAARFDNKISANNTFLNVALQISPFLIYFLVLFCNTTSILPLIKLEVNIICFFFLSIYLFSLLLNQTTDIIIFMNIIILQSILLLCADNLIVIFFLLEILNALVLYTMLYSNSVRNLLNINGASQITASFIYQFILNFFSSILLYSSINVFIVLTGGASLNSLNLFITDNSIQQILSITLVAFLIKFGTGPWIFFKINIYRGMNFQLISIYTILYLSLLFIFFANLFFVFQISILINYKIFSYLLITIACVSFSSLAFQTPNLFVFMSFSSLLNLTTFVLQIFTIS